jgi:membrane protease YdiL (CAAX protease family)
MSPRYWSFVLLTILLASAVSIATYRSARLLQVWKPDSNLLLLMSENVVRLLLIAICIGLGWLSGLPPAQLGWSFAGWQITIVQGLLWGAGMAGLFYVTTQFIIATTGERYYSPVVVEAMLPRNARELGLTAIAMVGVVMAEELLFRSLLLGGLQPIAPAMMLLLLTSLIFGILHLPQGVWGMVGATAAGVLLGSLLLWNGSILAPIAAHYVTNMAQIVQATRTGRKQKEKVETLDG